MRRRWSGLGAAVVALGGGAAACAAVGSPREAPPSAAGCYQFERGPDARRLGLPWGLELVDAPVEPGWPGLLARHPDARRALTAVSATDRLDHPFGYWAALPGDSVEVGAPGGGGLVLRLGRSGLDWTGTGRAAGDALRPGEPTGPRPAATVVARRVLCGAA